MNEKGLVLVRLYSPAYCSNLCLCMDLFVNVVDLRCGIWVSKEQCRGFLAILLEYGKKVSNST